VDNSASIQPARSIFISWGKSVQISGATSLGEKGRWATECFDKGVLRFGFSSGTESLKNLATTEKLEVLTFECDITKDHELSQIKEILEDLSISLSSLILLASIDRKLESLNDQSEEFEFEDWNKDFELGLTENYNLCKLYFSDLIKQESF
jgi:hypothetical protein